MIGSARDITAVHPSLRKPGSLEKEIFFEIPSSKDRREVKFFKKEDICHMCETALISFLFLL